MNPWTLIGWLILAGIAGWLLVYAVARVYLYGHEYIKYFRTRNIKPALGQEWFNDVTLENGEITHLKSDWLRIQFPGASIPFKYDEWERYKRRAMLYLESD